MVNGNHAFVFVVCGSKAYIDTLNVAIQCLKGRTRHRIVVVTDSRRNEGPIATESVIDMATPDHLNHHQASVYLKTSVHRYLDLDVGRYCYLDSDVLAITEKADDIFGANDSLIGFCADNMTLDLFSPYAVNCGCLEQARTDEQKLVTAQQTYAERLAEWNAFIKENQGDALIESIAGSRKKPFSNLFSLSRFSIEKALPFCKAAHFKGYRYIKKEQAWFDSSGKKVLYPIESYYDAVSRETGLRFDQAGNFWCDDRLQDVCIPKCTHLHQQIHREYGIRIEPDTWQHWNGGVFVFDQRSVDFLEFWHRETLRIFSEKDWKTRDQGTLALTAWKFQLERQPTLDKRFNYILDHHKPGLGFEVDKGFTRDDGIHWERPDMIHVYHRFGDPEWDLWQFIESNYLNL